MSFDWKETIRAVAPTIGTALGGPFAGMATKFVADKLLGNPDASTNEIASFVSSASPEKLLELKKLEQDFKVSLRELDIKEFQLEVQDKGSARAILSKDMRPQVILSSVFIVGYFVLLYLLLSSGKIDMNDKLLNLAMVLVGIITSEIPRIMAFWFGSSMGSKGKDFAIAEIKKA